MIHRAGCFNTKKGKLTQENDDDLYCDVRNEKPSLHEENQLIWECLCKTQHAILKKTRRSCGRSPWFDSLVTSARRTAVRRRQKRFLIERFVWHVASPNLVNRLRLTRTSQKTTTARTHRRSGENEGHVPIPSGYTHCKRYQKILV